MRYKFFIDCPWPLLQKTTCLMNDVIFDYSASISTECIVGCLSLL